MHKIGVLFRHANNCRFLREGGNPGLFAALQTAAVVEMLTYAGMSLILSRLVVSLREQTSIVPSLMQLSAVTILLMVMAPCRTKLAASYGEGTFFTHRVRTATWLSNLPVKDLSSIQSGKILSKLHGDLDAGVEFWRDGVSGLSAALIQTVFIISYALGTDVRLALVFVAAVLFAFILNIKISRGISSAHMMSRAAFDEIFSRYTEIFQNLEAVKSMDLCDTAHAKMKSLNSRYSRRVLKEDNNVELFRACQYIIALLPVFVTLCLSLYLVSMSKSDIPNLVGIMTFIMLRTSDIVNGFAAFTEKYRRCAVSLERYYELLTIPSERTDGDNSESGGVPLVRMENVSFAYENRPDTLNDVSIEVGAAESVAIVGASGTGKSTILKLLCGWYAPRTGSIHIMGRDISLWNLKAMRANITLAPQDLILFSGTLRENLLDGDRGVSDEKLTRVIDMTALGDLIDTPNGLDADVGIDGNALSGGQKQRAALARALIKNAKIVLLDETTSALDATTEKHIRQAILRAKDDGRGVLIVAHRLATINHCDRIYLLDGGKIVAQGTHRRLASTVKAYRELFGGQNEIMA